MTARPRRVPPDLSIADQPFAYRETRAGRRLYCESMPLAILAEEYGTPLYVYSATAIRERCRALDRAFAEAPHTICYSVKANPARGILRLMRSLKCGFDIVSGGELERVLLVDRRAAASVVFSGVGKTAAEMDAALRAGILMFNVESESELELLAVRAARLRQTARVALRVNPDVQAETHPYISTGLRQHKFGVPMGDAARLYAWCGRQTHLQPAGVSVHIGSQIMDVAPFAAAMRRVASLVRELRAAGHSIGYVDAGGGLGINYDHDRARPMQQQARAYAKAILPAISNLDIHLILEPGRVIVGPAGALVTGVLYRKENGAKRFIVTDAAMNDLLRPSLYGAQHRILPVEGRAGTPETVDVVGPICETGDFFARSRRLPRVAEGELLAVMDTGAYGMSLSSNYNSRPRAAEVMVEGRRARLIRRREVIEDLVRSEL
jgi:diaminopimelate decarboxylase